MANGNTNPGIGENADSGVVHNPQPSRARTRGMSYGDINNIPFPFVHVKMQELNLSMLPEYRLFH